MLFDDFESMSLQKLKLCCGLKNVFICFKAVLKNEKCFFLILTLSNNFFLHLTLNILCWNAFDFCIITVHKSWPFGQIYLREISFHIASAWINLGPVYLWRIPTLNSHWHWWGCIFYGIGNHLWIGPCNWKVHKKLLLRAYWSFWGKYFFCCKNSGEGGQRKWVHNGIKG